MSKEQVTFIINDLQVRSKYPKNLLRVGTRLYVQFENDAPIEFAACQQDTTWTPYTVVWISPSTWTVTLQQRFQAPANVIQAIFHAVDGFIDQKQVLNALEILAQDIHPTRLHRTDELQGSRIQLLYTVAQRLELCDRLRTEGVGKELFAHHRGLVIYLLLTCFDRLGQPSDWLTFDSWLKAQRTESERGIALSQLDGSENPVAIAEKLYTAYNDLYGVRNSFFRFLHELLPTQARIRLLSSIWIIKGQYPPDMGSNSEASDEDKEKYLFRLRNEYTHKAQYISGTSEDQMAKMTPLELLDQQTWYFHEQRFLSSHWESIFVLDWPTVLYETVRAGLVEYILRIFDEPDGLTTA